jgi:two-component sensor histidine kinase
VDLDLDPVLVAVDSAVPLGLILHELVANAYQHAFPPDASGRIHVAETHEGARIRLVVEDDGVGMDVSRPRSPSSLGLTLVDALVAQIEGELTTESDGGTRVSVQASVGDGA